MIKIRLSLHYLTIDNEYFCDNVFLYKEKFRYMYHIR